MKRILKTLLIVPLALSLLLALGLAVSVQQGLVTKSVLLYLVELAQRDGIGAVALLFKAEWGMDLDESSDPSFGREQIEGRGNAPWVVRGNLDDRPRVISLALAPGLWAAYDTENASLYQVWEGDILFQGAAYDYRHGPQPASRGRWLRRDTVGSQWYLTVAGRDLPATLRYLGHDYGSGRKTVRMRYSLQAGEHRLELGEQPDVLERNGRRYFTRSFSTAGGPGPVSAAFVDGHGVRREATGILEYPLDSGTDIIADMGSGFPGLPEQDALAFGESVIANSDCLGCHASQHRVSGPAWAEIAGKFQGRLQDQVIEALSRSIAQGGVGTWGKVPMPPHPELEPAELRAAVSYILTIEPSGAALNPPLDESGTPYPASTDYDIRPGLESLHPSFVLEDLAPPGFEPKVGGLAFRPDGKLLVASWDLDGALYLIDPSAPLSRRVRRIAEGLHEPLGLTLVGDRLFVLQKQELTELIDLDGDEVIDRYASFSSDWPVSANFHSFAFGLEHRDDGFYFLLSICVLPGGASCPEQFPTQGKLLRSDMLGRVTEVASGFRTPNGIASGPGGELIVADNQGDWLPASKLVSVREGAFYGSRAVPDEGVMSREETPPLVWLPQDEVGNSPTQPLVLVEGPYAGQLIHGDVYNGGVKRVFTEKVGGELQGAAFHFSAGFKGAVNRLARGPDGAIYLGEVGNPPNWGEYGKAWHGLERMRWVDNNAFEILAVRAEHNGFTLEMTRPLAEGLEPAAQDLLVRQWFYRPDEQYGGPKYDETLLRPATLSLSQNRRELRAVIPGLKAGYVVYLRLDDRLRSQSGQPLWTSEAWYTLNSIPPPDVPAAESAARLDAGDWQLLFDGQTLDGWRHYRGEPGEVEKWVARDGVLELQQRGWFPMWDLIAGVAFGVASGDLMYHREKFRNFELSLEWKIAPGGNSGIFYLVADEQENAPWYTGLEMQVLDNDGHADGQIESHRAGDLYGLVAGQPERVRPVGEWNHVVIRVEDGRVEHWLNGERVLSADLNSADWKARVAASKFADMPRFGQSREGHIVLQDHGDPVWYRNIRVRSLGGGSEDRKLQ